MEEDFLARLAARVLKPRVNPGSSPGQVLTRVHGVLAPNRRDRASVTSGKRGKGAKPQAFKEGQEKTPAGRRAAMTPDQVGGRLWAQRLKRVFGIETCPACGGALRIIACLEDPAVIKKILTHLDTQEASAEPSRLPPCRAPPQARLR